MNEILNFAWEFRFIIVIAIAILLYALLEWQKFKATAYALMLQAKRLAKDAVLNSGQQQEEWVVKKAYQFLPKSWTIFISEATMRKIVHWLYEKAKDYLDDGKINDSYKDNNVTPA
ncbi:hypothetical protein [Caloramator australicus]|uniref:Uncharacterized protein n=1 Tax=Caloramator australicus RC3 TaxID=857293 RepID=I7K698_9CLOT|nr:hypothetical protein [Caloramator australicus]CCJ33084.1 hypothetical protein CAAU_1000 [Caloramator australicus RC3]